MRKRAVELNELEAGSNAAYLPTGHDKKHVQPNFHKAQVCGHALIPLASACFGRAVLTLTGSIYSLFTQACSCCHQRSHMCPVGSHIGARYTKHAGPCPAIHDARGPSGADNGCHVGLQHLILLCVPCCAKMFACCNSVLLLVASSCYRQHVSLVMPAFCT